MYLINDKNTFRIGKNLFINVNGNDTRFFDTHGIRSYIQTSVLKKKLEEMCMLPLRANGPFEHPYKELLLKIANA